MKIKKRYIFLIIFCFIFVYNNFFPSWIITGSYTSSVEDPFAAGGIDDNEKLEIYSDGTFYGDTWGDGIWTLEHELKGTRIYFRFGNEGYNTYFYRRLFFSSPRIVIFRDLNSEFLKD